MVNKISFAFFMLFSLFTSTVMATASLSPTAQVKSTVDAVLEALKNQTLNKQERREKLRELIKSQFDFRTMSQGVLATHWKKVSAEERERFIDLFSQLLEWTYIGRIEAYTDEKVEYTNEKIKGKRALVETMIITANAQIPIIYKLIKRDDKWLVYNVLIEKVNLVRNYRDSYRSIVKKEGIGGLLAKMEQKVEELKSKADGAETNI